MYIDHITILMEGDSFWLRHEERNDTIVNV